jgi:hypothetical protein
LTSCMFKCAVGSLNAWLAGVVVVASLASFISTSPVASAAAAAWEHRPCDIRRRRLIGSRAERVAVKLIVAPRASAGGGRGCSTSAITRGRFVLASRGLYHCRL